MKNPRTGSTNFDQDWAAEQRKLRIQMAQIQTRMEIADEELSRGGNPIAAVILILLAVGLMVPIILYFADMIDSMGVM